MLINIGGQSGTSAKPLKCLLIISSVINVWWMVCSVRIIQSTSHFERGGQIHTNWVCVCMQACCDILSITDTVLYARHLIRDDFKNEKGDFYWNWNKHLIAFIETASQCLTLIYQMVWSAGALHIICEPISKQSRQPGGNMVKGIKKIINQFNLLICNSSNLISSAALYHF